MFFDSTNKVVIVSRDACIYCDKSKKFLDEKAIPYEVLKLDLDDEDYDKKKDELVTTTNQKTFPFIFINGDFIGGYNELVQAFNTLRLHELCETFGMKISMDF